MRVLRNIIVFLAGLLIVAIPLRKDGFRAVRMVASLFSGTSIHPPTRRPVPDRPVCGLADDEQIHLPPNWNSFTPPAMGQTYVDPAFDCSVKRLTDSSSEETAWDGKHVGFMNYYSTLTAINANDTALFVVSSDGNWRIKNVNGGVVIPSAKMPGFSGHPVWDASDGNVFYYASQSSLSKASLAGASIKSTVIHEFNEYKAIVSPDAADLSQDGDHIALVGQNAGGTMDIFVWSLRERMKTSIYTTVCAIDGDINGVGQPGCVHKLQLTPDNLLTIQFARDGNGVEEGVRLWNGSTLIHLQDRTNHYDTGYDINTRSVFIASNNSATLPGLINPCPSGWGLETRELGNLRSAQCLLDHQPYWHVSYRGGPSQPWLTLSFFDDRKSGPELFSNNVQYQTPAATNWKLYEDEIVLVKVDGSGVYRLAHARSRSSEDYWAQPHAALSRDGKYVVFTSNMAFPNGCPNNMHVANECSDVYVVKVR